jgi:hypothetical protein
MPLKVMDMVELRVQVVSEVQSGLLPVREVAARHGIGAGFAQGSPGAPSRRRGTGSP